MAFNVQCPHTCDLRGRPVWSGSAKLQLHSRPADVVRSSLLQSNELDGSTRDMRAELEQVGDQTNWENGLSHIMYHPTAEQQQAAQREGKSGQFRVNYQVQMEPEGEIQVNFQSNPDLESHL